jgi:predicted RNA methylase
VPVRDVIFNNGNWFGPVIEWSAADTDSFSDYTTNALPFEINYPGNVLIPDAGTGLFASHALTRGVGHVTAVEQNRVAVNLLKNELAQ